MTLLLPFHQDERLDDDLIPVPDDTVRLDPALPEGEQWPRLRELFDRFADAVAAQAGSGRVRLVTGDCLAAVGAVTGLQRAGRDPGIVWIDAHGDVHTLASSTSGYLGGMPLRMLVGGDPDRLTGPLGTRLLPEARAALVDARDLDPAEADYLAASDLRHVQVADADPELVEGDYLVHLDLDVIDGDDLPGMLFPTPRGPSESDVVAGVRRLLADPRCLGLEIACPWHPTDDVSLRERRAELLGTLLAL